jgi:hypothetical protein
MDSGVESGTGVGMVSHLSGRAHHNPEHADQGPPSCAVNAGSRFDRSPRPPHLSIGHRHARALRLVHEALADLGVQEAVRRLDPWLLTRAAAAARYFGLPDLAGLLDRAEQAAGSTVDAAEFDGAYRRSFASGTAVSDAIARRMAQFPTDFPE